MVGRSVAVRLGRIGGTHEGDAVREDAVDFGGRGEGVGERGLCDRDLLSRLVVRVEPKIDMSIYARDIAETRIADIPSVSESVVKHRFLFLLSSAGDTGDVQDGHALGER